MARVVGVDAPDRLENLLQRREGEQPFAGRQDVAEAGVLGDDRTAAREVAGAAVAEPAAAQPHVLVLGDRELAARLADVLPIGVEVLVECRGVTDAPSVRREHLAVLIERVHEGELERLVAVARQVDELLELEVLAPVVGLAAEGDRAVRLTPVGDRRERLGCAAVKRRPEIHHDRLTRRHEREPIGPGHPAIGVAVVLAPREKGAVGRQVVDDALVAIVERDLDLDRVGPDVDEAAAGAMFGSRHGAAVEVEDHGGVAQHRRQCRFRQPEALVAIMGRAERPAVVLEAETTHQAGDECRRQRRRRPAAGRPSASTASCRAPRRNRRRSPVA